MDRNLYIYIGGYINNNKGRHRELNEWRAVILDEIPFYILFIFGLTFCCFCLGSCLSVSVSVSAWVLCAGVCVWMDGWVGELWGIKPRCDYVYTERKKVRQLKKAFPIPFSFSKRPLYNELLSSSFSQCTNVCFVFLGICIIHVLSAWREGAEWGWWWPR